MKRVGPKNPSSGFSLIEVMIVGVIIAVLTLVAYPAYQSSTVKSNRSEAQAYLLDLAQKEQLFFNDSRTYAASVAELNSTAPERVASNYAVTFEVTTLDPPPTFTITATPIAGTRQARDGTLVIDNRGAKTRGGEPW